MFSSVVFILCGWVPPATDGVELFQAAKESRRRKKMRIEELGRSVVFLTRENQELREQNEIFRQMVVSRDKRSPPPCFPSAYSPSAQSIVSLS